MREGQGELRPFPTRRKCRARVFLCAVQHGETSQGQARQGRALLMDAPEMVRMTVQMGRIPVVFTWPVDDPNAAQRAEYVRGLQAKYARSAL